MGEPVVHGPAFSTYVRSVRLALHEKGVPHQLVEVDVLGGAHKQSPHIERHPFGKVPVLQHDGFEAMVEFTAPVFWAFLFLVGLALFVLRAKDPHAERPFRVPLYPLTPIVFCAACAWLTWSSITYAVSRDAIRVSLSVMALGVCAWLVTRAHARSRAAAGPE